VSISGTDSYQNLRGLPPLVARAVELARELRFPHSCRVEQGRLLHALASGAVTAIGETGTGCGVGLAWLASAASREVPIVSVEQDPVRAQRAAELFAHLPNVTVRCGDWSLLVADGPFDLLVLDGGGNAKSPSGGAAEPQEMLVLGGTLVVDDFEPCAVWPPVYDGGTLDEARLHWLEHPSLRAAEVRLAPDLASVVGTRR
jgi:predicted O-methyltransferase YrrM